MNLREIINQVEVLSEDLVIFARRNGDWKLDAPAALILSADMKSIGVDLEDLVYFLEVSIAKEVLDVWQNWRDGRTPNENERIEALFYYVDNDAYLA